MDGWGKILLRGSGAAKNEGRLGEINRKLKKIRLNIFFHLRAGNFAEAATGRCVLHDIKYLLLLLSHFPLFLFLAMN